MGIKWQREKNKILQHKRMGIGMFKTIDNSRYVTMTGGGDPPDLRGKFLSPGESGPGYVYAPYIPFCSGVTINNSPVLRCPKTRARMSIMRMGDMGRKHWRNRRQRHEDKSNSSNQ